MVKKKLKADHRGDVVKQMKIREATLLMIDEVMDEMKIQHNERGITRSKILARCVEIGLKQVIKTLKT